MSGRTVRLGLLIAGLAGGVLVARPAWQRWMDVWVPAFPPATHVGVSRACPDEGERIHVEWKGRAATWSETIEGADLIVVAKRLAGRAQVKDRGNCDFVSYYAFTVLQTVKGNVRVGDALTVGWRGRPTDRVDDLPHPETGEPLVLFLNRQDGLYYPAYGPGGIVRVVQGILAPYCESDYGWSEVMGSPLDRFLACLRQHEKAR